MKQILLLTKSYFHKTKGQMATLIALVAIAVMLLNIGIIMQIGLSTFFDQRAEELNAPHFTVVVGHGLADSTEVEEFLTHHESVVELEQRDILFSWGELFIGDVAFNQALILETNDPSNTMNPPTLIGDYLPLEGDAIYIPHFLMVDNNLSIGDPLRLIFRQEEIWFTVAGSTEEILLGSLMNGGIRFYISDEKAENLRVEFPNSIYSFITTRLEQPEDSNRLFNDINNATFTFNEENVYGSMYFLPMTYEFARETRTFMATIVGITVMALAGILFIICAVVVRFRINNHIETTIKNIGILKAMGYENKQIIGSISLQFGGLTLVGGMAGIGLTLVALPFVAHMMEGQIGLVWRPRVEFWAGSFTLLAVVVFILMLTFLSTRRVKKLYPLMALRDGITTHNFRKNYFALEKAKSPLSLSLSFKQILQNKKQLVMFTLIVAGLSFSAVASLTIYYSMLVNNEAFSNTIGGTVFDVSVIVQDDDVIEEIRGRLEEMPEVARLTARSLGGNRANLDDVNVSLVIVEDTAYLGNHMLVEGRFPVHANEIAISPVLANMPDFEIGQTVTMNREEVETQFLVTGVVQMMQDMGFFSLLTEEGMNRFDPDVRLRLIDMDLIAGVEIDDFIDLVEARDGDVIRAFSGRRDIEAILAGMGTAVTPVAIGNVIISAVVITLVLYMIMKTMIMRRHRELGIQKALGFTNFQLMNQLAMNLLPVIILGTAVGAVAGYFGFNSIFVALMSGTGIGTADLPTPLLWVIILVIGMVALSYGVAMLISRRIRKISAYQLVSE